MPQDKVEPRIATTVEEDTWVSVVVPTYNRSTLLPETLDSIKNQSYRPIEIVVVDDGSTDDTVEVIVKWADRHQESNQLVVVTLRQPNKGANAARNLGVKHARGSLIAFIDSDDRWLPQKLAKQIPALLSDRRPGGVYCGVRNFDLATWQVIEPEPRAYPRGNLLKALLIKDVTAPTSCWLLKRHFFENVGYFDESLPARQDWDMWIRLAEKYEIGCVPEVLVEMGNHPGERIRSNISREIQAHKAIFRRYAYLRKQFPFTVSLAARSAMYRRRGRVYFHRNVSKGKAFVSQVMAIIVWPFEVDSYAALIGMILPTNLRKDLRYSWNRVFGKTLLAIKNH